MTSQLETQISRYAKYVDEHVDPVDIDAIRRRNNQQALAPRPTSRRLVVSFAVAAVLTLAVLVPILLLVGDAEPDVATTLPNPTDPPQVTTTLGDAAPADPDPLFVRNLPPITEAGWTWSLSPIDLQTVHGRFRDGTWYRFDIGWDCIEDGQLYRITGAPSTLCANGEPVDDPLEVMHLSRDAITWEAVPIPEFEGQMVGGDLLEAGPLVVAARSADDIGLAEFLSPYTFWSTFDGRTWVEINSTVPDATPEGIDSTFGNRTMTVATGSIVVKVTSCPHSGYLAVSTDDGASYTIVDGLPGAAEVDPNEIIEAFDRSGVHGLGQVDMTCGSHRTLLHQVFTIGGALHALSFPDTEADPILWQSANGREWERVGTTSGYPKLEGRPFGQGVGDELADLGSAAVSSALLSDRSGFPAVYVVTDDGLVWDEIEVPGCARRASISHVNETLPGPTPSSSWIMLSTCADGSESHLVGHYDSGVFTWYQTGLPKPREQGTLEVNRFGSALTARYWNPSSDPAVELWIATPPK